MYLNNHDGKHMTGDRMKILLLNLPFLLRGLVAPEVRFDIFPDIIPDNVPDIMSDINDIFPDIIPDNVPDIMSDIGADIVVIFVF
jgi:hypothetical protein